MTRTCGRLRFLMTIAFAVAALLLATTLGRPAPARAGIPPGRPAAVRQDISGSITLRQGGRVETRSITGTLDLNLSASDPALRSRIEIEGVAVTEMVIVNGTAYTRQDGGEWQTAPAPETLSRQVALANAAPEEQAQAARDQLAALNAAGIEVVQVGEEAVRDLPTRHERVEATGAQLRDLLVNLPPALAMAFAGPLSPEQLETLPADLRMTADTWTGVADGFVYRTTLRLASGPLEIEITYDNLPLPQPVAIVAPV